VIKQTTYLKTRWYIDRALKSAVLEFFHRIHREGGICVGKERRRSPVARNCETTVIGQMHAYLLFLETW
jgi:hypothetical protein